MTARSLRRRPRDGSGPERRLDRFLAEVEPAVAGVPRVHRFASVPRVGDERARPVPLPVVVEGADVAARRTTLDSLGGQTVAPAEVLEGSLADLAGSGRTGWVSVVAAGDVLAPGALERLGQAVALAPDARLVTCDEDRLDPAGRRRDPVLRPGPSPDLLPARDLTSSLVAVRIESLAGDARRPLWRYRTALRLAGDDPAALAHAPVILNHRPAPRSELPWAEGRAVRDALRGTGAAVERGAGGRRRVRRALEGEPSVAVVVLFRDEPALLERCARSVLASSYARIELRLVDNGSEDPEVEPLLDVLRRDGRVTVLRDARPFNFAALNNAAVRDARADVLVFLNNDTEVMTASWIEELLEEALRPEVGAVGPLLLYPDARVQHAGAALGLHGFAGHPFAGLHPDEPTPFGTATDGTRNWLAVTAACLMVEKAKFDAVDGFDEGFVVAGNDVDLCLRLTARGHRSLCVPHVELLHDESRSRGSYIDPGDFERSARSYGEFLTVGDPFYNPNLTLTATTCDLRQPGEPSA